MLSVYGYFRCEPMQEERKRNMAGEIAKYEEMLDEWDERHDDVQEIIMKLEIIPAEVRSCVFAQLLVVAASRTSVHVVRVVLYWK